MVIEDNTSSVLPWYRQGWAWFLLTPLIAIIVVMAAYISVAVKLSDDVVVDNYYREGRMYNDRLEQDQLAASLEVSAQIQFDLETGEVFLTLAMNAQPDQVVDVKSLVLLIQHPTEADLDQVVILTATGDGKFRGDLDLGLHYSRYLQLFPGDSAVDRATAKWRLKSQVDFEKAQSLTMQPSEVVAADR